MLSASYLTLVLVAGTVAAGALLSKRIPLPSLVYLVDKNHNIPFLTLL